ncbi:MAG TPA: GIY-YIG nuclease family protein [Conexibacter sp.]|nr:GIY-YIG nuclease family protein [Conexibacter sp.]
MLLRAYGEWWDPLDVKWGAPQPGGQGALVGRIGRYRGLETDVWDQRGIYVLFQDWRVVYVGKTGERPLGTRLRAHLYDDVAGRWDRFSWYGVRIVNSDGSLGSTPAPTRQVHARDVIATLESILIRVTAPSLNHRRERIPGAQLVVQDAETAPRPLRSYVAGIERQLEDLAERVESLAESA